MDIFSATKWTVCNGYFKALVRLEPGPNKLRFEYINSRSSSFSTEFLINMLPLSANTPLQLAVLIGSDSSGERNRRFGGENSQKDDENWSDVIVKKLRMAGYVETFVTWMSLTILVIFYKHSPATTCIAIDWVCWYSISQRSSDTEQYRTTVLSFRRGVDRRHLISTRGDEHEEHCKGPHYSNSEYCWW